MKRVLRAFEMALFDELGVSINWEADGMGRMIDPVLRYEFIPNQGFVVAPNGRFTGETITMLAKNNDINDAHLNDRGRIYRSLMDFLLDYRPLNSRKLWADQLKYR